LTPKLPERPLQYRTSRSPARAAVAEQEPPPVSLLDSNAWICRKNRRPELPPARVAVDERPSAIKTRRKGGAERSAAAGPWTGDRNKRPPSPTATRTDAPSPGMTRNPTPPQKDRNTHLTGTSPKLMGTPPPAPPRSSKSFPPPTRKLTPPPEWKKTDLTRPPEKTPYPPRRNQNSSPSAPLEATPTRRRSKTPVADAGGSAVEPPPPPKKHRGDLTLGGDYLCRRDLQLDT